MSSCSKIGLESWNTSDTFTICVLRSNHHIFAYLGESGRCFHLRGNTVSKNDHDYAPASVPFPKKRAKHSTDSKRTNKKKKKESTAKTTAEKGARDS
eukprot:g15033.t1